MEQDGKSSLAELAPGKEAIGGVRVRMRRELSTIEFLVWEIKDCTMTSIVLNKLCDPVGDADKDDVVQEVQLELTGDWGHSRYHTLQSPSIAPRNFY